MAFFRWQNGDLVLFCHLQPKASADDFAGLHGERLKIRIKAPPVDGKANAYLLKFLAAEFGVPPSQIELLAGDSARQKTVLIRAPKILPPSLGITPA